MAYRSLDLTLASAKDLKNVNLFSRMEVYAVVSLSSEPRARQRTSPDREGGRNPTWNSTLHFTVPGDADLAGHLFLQVVLRTVRFLGDRAVGEVRVPIKELLAGSGDGASPAQFLSYQVRRTGAGKPKGVLNFSYKLGECSAAPPSSAPPPAMYPPAITAYPAAAPYPPHDKAPKAGDEPVMAYPVGSSSATAAAAPYPAYPPHGVYPGYQQPPPYGYAPQPHQGYGYPPAGYGYGPVAGAAPPVVAQPRQKKSRFGMGMGAGMLGGALGGLLIGDMISDAGAYDAGYDAGFDDGGAFGF